MKIHVRRRHIMKGKDVLSPCPIALAFKDATGKRPRVYWQALFTDTESFILPASAQRFIARFDAGKPVKPFAFVLK